MRNLQKTLQRKWIVEVHGASLLNTGKTPANFMPTWQQTIWAAF